MDKLTDPRDREGFLYVKTPKDYQLGYHHKVQEGRSRTTLQQYPSVKIEKYVPRDQVTQNRHIFKILNDRKKKMKEDHAKELIWRFDNNYDPEPVL